MGDPCGVHVSGTPLVGTRQDYTTSSWVQLEESRGRHRRGHCLMQQNRYFASMITVFVIHHLDRLSCTRSYLHRSVLTGEHYSSVSGLLSTIFRTFPDFDVCPMGRPRYCALKRFLFFLAHVVRFSRHDAEEMVANRMMPARTCLAGEYFSAIPHLFDSG